MGLLSKKQKRKVTIVSPSPTPVVAHHPPTSAQPTSPHNVAMRVASLEFDATMRRAHAERLAAQDALIANEVDRLRAQAQANHRQQDQNKAKIVAEEQAANQLKAGVSKLVPPAMPRRRSSRNKVHPWNKKGSRHAHFA